MRGRSPSRGRLPEPPHELGEQAKRIRVVVLADELRSHVGASLAHVRAAVREAVALGDGATALGVVVPYGEGEVPLNRDDPNLILIVSLEPLHHD